MSKMKIFFARLSRRTEFYVFLTLVALCLLVQVKSGQFFTSNNIVDILRSMVIPGLFSLTSLMVVISGGFDLSFPGLASLACSAATTILVAVNYQGSVWLAFLMAGTFGFVLGTLNGWVISRFQLPTMIVTLATQAVFMGLMLGVLDLREITSTMPPGLLAFGDAALFEVAGPSGLRSAMPLTFLFLIVLALAVSFVLKYTMFGRSLYAIGGNEVSAARAGINVKKTKFFLYALVGALSGMIGVIRICMARQSIPNGLTGMDMKVLPAIILGGASIFGGEGTVVGSLLAIGLITTMQNSMLLIGVNTYWQDFFTGMVILIGVTVSALQVKRAKR